MSMGFPRKEYWSGWPFPFPGDFPYPGIEPTSSTLAGRFFTAELPGEPKGFTVVAWARQLAKLILKGNNALDLLNFSLGL